MRRIPLEMIKRGMVLAKTVYGPVGQVLLSEGMELKPQYAVYLRHLGIDYLYVKDNRMLDLEVDDIITEGTRQEARLLVREVMEGKSKYSNQKSIIFGDEKIRETVNKIIDELLSNKEIIVNLLDIRAVAGYTFAHSVNTCVLATLTAIRQSCSPEQLENLAIGSLLHDIGYVVVPPEILQKKEILNQDEYGLVKTHSVFGLELIKNSSLYNEEVGKVIVQHHERRNGEGYPQGLVGDEINPLAQIVAVADVYDALTSTRPYRSAYQPYEAVEMLSAWGEELFSLENIRSFLSCIAAYPVGSHVMLSSGESGLVIANTPGYTMRPVVRVLYTGEGMAPLTEPYELDLTDTLDLTITKVLG